MERSKKNEYKKIESERRKKSRTLYEKAISSGIAYPPDFIYLWEYMQAKNIGVRFALGVIYQLGFLYGKQEQTNDGCIAG